MAHRYCLLILVLIAFLHGGATSAEPTPLAFGVLNQQSPPVTAERWNPMLSYLSRRTGIPLRLRMGATVERTNAMMAAGEFDLVFTNHNFRPEYDTLGFRVIARWGGAPSRAAIAVVADSTVATLTDLGGHRVAFPSTHAFLGYAVQSVALKQAGIAVESVFAGNQEGALAQLKARRVDAAAVNSRFLEQYAAREGLQLRAVYQSEPFPDLAVIAHDRLGPATVALLRQALVGMAADAAAAEILAQAGCPGFAAADDADYDQVRAVYRAAAQ